MSTKKKEKRVSARNKSVLPLKVKIEMLDRLHLGESFASISRSFNVNESTVRSIKKSEDKIRSSIASYSLSAKIVRDPAIEKMEVALSFWIEDCNQKRVPLSGAMVREKAKRLYAHFKEPDGRCGGGECTDGGFQASEGWFNKFKVRQSLHSINSDEEPSTSTGNVTFNLKNLSEGLRMANELCDFFMKIDPSTERNLILKKNIINATAQYKSEFKNVLRTTKQEKVFKLIKPFPKANSND